MKHGIIDLEGLRKLSGNDEEFINEILELYSQRVERDIEELERAFEAKDWDALRFVSHRMRSSSIPLGLKDLVVLLKRTELELKSGSLSRIPEYVTRIISITKQAQSEVNNLIKEPSS